MYENSVDRVLKKITLKLYIIHRKMSISFFFFFDIQWVCNQAKDLKQLIFGSNKNGHLIVFNEAS